MIRRRAALGLVAFVALWPAVTLVLQARWGVDPWKLMGFGMYAAPGRRVEDVSLTLWVKRAGQWHAVEQALVAEESIRFIGWRRSLGRLASPQQLARAMLEASGGEAARVQVQSIRLDATSARVVFEREVLELPQPP